MTSDPQYKIRKTTAVDIESILQVFDEARAFQRRQGFVQWTDGYPDRDIVARDIESGSSYVVVSSGIIAGYFAIAFNDPGYTGLESIWTCKGDFAVVHRLALSDKTRGSGLSSIILLEAENIARSAGAGSMRIDTGEENRIMQHLMKKLGYSGKGTLEFPWGSRLGFEKRL